MSSYTPMSCFPQVMVSNIESIVERGERLDLIVDKAENLSNEAVTFRQSGRRLQRRMWWQNAKMKVRRHG